MSRLKPLFLIIVVLSIIVAISFVVFKDKAQEIAKSLYTKYNLETTQDFINIQDKLKKKASRTLLNCTTDEYWGQVGEVSDTGDLIKDSFEFIQENSLVNFKKSMCSPLINQASNSAQFSPKKGDLVSIEIYKCKNPDWANSTCNVLKKLKVEKVEQGKIHAIQGSDKVVIQLPEEFDYTVSAINKEVVESETNVSQYNINALKLEKWGAMYIKSAEFEATSSSSEVPSIQAVNKYPRIYLETIL